MACETVINGGYKLQSVNDAGLQEHVADRKHFVDGSNAGNQYIYDAAGRMTSDLNRQVEFSYNRINLPRQVRFESQCTKIDYLYDAAGNKLQKHVGELQVPGLSACRLPLDNITDYIGNFVYENDELVMIYHPEGVIRPTPAAATNTTEFVYDYFIKDYLGNVRVVVTDEDATYATESVETMEHIYRDLERELFDNIDDTEDDLPPGYPSGGLTELNEKIARVVAENEFAMGPSKLLRVQRGERIRAEVDYFFTEDAPGTTYSALNFFVTEVLVSLINSAVGTVPYTEAQLLSMMGEQGHLAPQLTQFLTTQFDTEDMDRPHGYLVYLQYDNNFNLVPLGSGARRVENPNQLEHLLTDEILIETDGFMHMYAGPSRSSRVSNGSMSPIFYDNFEVTVMRGKTRQINHYYPYGLRINSIDGHPEDYKNMYTSKELQTGEFDPTASTGLEMYDFHARFYDPQLGRWFAPDPAEQFHNPYLAMGNNPVMYVDPDGEAVILVLGIGALVGAYVGGATAAGDGGLMGANWNPFGGERGSWDFNDPYKDVLGGMVGGAITGMALASGAAGAGVFGAKAKGAMIAAKSTKTAKMVGTTSGGLFNMMNHHDSQKGFGWHSVGYFAAGAMGAAAGIADGASTGIALGGILNIGAVAAAGDHVTRAEQRNGQSGYTILQSFVGGAVSSMAGKNIYDSAMKSWGLGKTKALTNTTFGKFINYGSSNVAANYAFDKKGKFQDTHAGVHAMSFFVGGFAGSLNSKLMGDNQLYGESPIANFAKRLAISSAVLHGEYFLNKQLNSNYINWYDYRRYKRGPLGLKATGYSSFYGF